MSCRRIAPGRGAWVARGLPSVILSMHGWWGSQISNASGLAGGACRGFCGGVEIERRPRGASRPRSLLHLLQRTEPERAALPALVHVLRHVWRHQCPPQNPVMPTGLTTPLCQAWPRCNKCRSDLGRDAPRGRRSILQALHRSSHAPPS
jgi:hypothetical protein